MTFRRDVLEQDRRKKHRADPLLNVGRSADEVRLRNARDRCEQVAEVVGRGPEELRCTLRCPVDAAEPSRGTGICCDPHPFNPECASPSITLRCMRMNRIRIGAIAISEAAIMTG